MGPCMGRWPWVVMLLVVMAAVGGHGWSWVVMAAVGDHAVGPGAQSKRGWQGRRLCQAQQLAGRKVGVRSSTLGLSMSCVRGGLCCSQNKAGGNPAAGQRAAACGAAGRLRSPTLVPGSTQVVLGRPRLVTPDQVHHHTHLNRKGAAGLMLVRVDTTPTLGPPRHTVSMAWSEMQPCEQGRGGAGVSSGDEPEMKR